MANERRLIDAEELWERVRTEMEDDDAERSDEVLRVIDTAPAIDAVEVVHCRECAHWDADLSRCNHPNGMNFDESEVPEDCFCCLGEKRQTRQTMTIGDRIRSYSDEKLSDFLADMTCEFDYYRDKYTYRLPGSSRRVACKKEACEKWLKVLQEM